MFSYILSTTKTHSTKIRNNKPPDASEEFQNTELKGLQKSAPVNRSGNTPKLEKKSEAP